MRVNIYSEELTPEVEIIKKAVDQKLFYGVRFYLKSHPDLHHGQSDNDRSAVTFWVPWTKKYGTDFQKVIEIFAEGINQLNEAQQKEEKDAKS